MVEIGALIALHGQTVASHRAVQDFDLVVAISGGSPVLARLVENLGLGAILSLVKDEANRRALFRQPPLARRPTPGVLADLTTVATTDARSG